MRNTTLELNYYYRPQRSCGKVMFFTRICHCVHRGGGGACMVGGHVWQGVRCGWQGVHGGGGIRGRGTCGGGHVWQGVCMAGGCVAKGGMRGRRDGHCSGRYASYWNAFLSKVKVRILFSENCSFGQTKKQYRVYQFKSILTKLK